MRARQSMSPGTTPSKIELNPEKIKKNKDERRRIIIALLFLLLSFGCIFCSSQSALWLIDRSRIEAGMLSTRRADYRADISLALAPLEADIAAEAEHDEATLSIKQTPIAGGLGIVIIPPALPTPAPTEVALLPTPTPTPTISVPPDSGPSTPLPDTPAPTSVAPPPASPPPPAPPTTLPPTVPPATLPPTTLPPTSPPPTVVSPPTSLPPTPTTLSPTATSTALPTPTNTPTPPAVYFAAASITVNENAGTALITVSLSAVPALTVTVNYAVSDGFPPNAATNGTDYTAATGGLTFAPGVTGQAFAVTLLNDTLDELDETVNLTLSTPVNATLGTPSSAVLTIVDDDNAPMVQFDSNIYTVTEGNSGSSSATITVILSAPSALVVTVNYATGDGTATTSDSDYSPASGTLTFLPLQTSQTFTVSILGDTVYEADETVNLTLTPVSNATLGTPGSATLTITNDDALPTVQFSSPTYNVDEGDGDATITVTLSSASASPVTVDYTTSDGTALAGSDYIPTGGTLTFPPLQTSQTFPVTIINDAGQEPSPETVLLSLNNPLNATIGITNPATLNITDNDSGGGCSASNPPTVIDIGPPDCRWTNVGGSTIIVDVTATPITVNLSDADFDLVYYERESPTAGQIAVDRVIVEISQDPGGPWYPVFYWGDGGPDTNTNVGQAGINGAEVNNTYIPMSDPPLYRSSTGPITGIAIDVDEPLADIPGAPSGDYLYIRVIGGGETEVDSIEVLP